MQEGRNTITVYVDGFGVTINKFFAQRYQIEPGASVHPSVIDRHIKEVPAEVQGKSLTLSIDEAHDPYPEASQELRTILYRRCVL